MSLPSTQVCPGRASGSLPVLVKIHLINSLPSYNFKLIWDDVKKSIIDLYADMRFFELTVGNDRKFDKTIAPSYLQHYTSRFPMILLVPGSLWDHAIENLGPYNSVEIKDNVQTMNSYWDGNDLSYFPSYSYMRKEEILLWLNQAYTKLAQ